MARGYELTSLRVASMIPFGLISCTTLSGVPEHRGSDVRVRLKTVLHRKRASRKSPQETNTRDKNQKDDDERPTNRQNWPTYRQGY
jgi:hypothetical protein